MFANDPFGSNGNCFGIFYPPEKSKPECWIELFWGWFVIWPMSTGSVPGENSWLAWEIRIVNLDYTTIDGWIVKIKLVVLKKSLYLSFNFGYSCMVIYVLDL